MTETSMMYAGTATDTREYYAADIATFFRAQLKSGVCYGLLDSFEVVDSSPGDLELNIKTGKAWVYGQFVVNDAATTKTLDTPSASNRIDRIILRNTIASGITLEVLKGTEAASPVAPALTQTATVYEISLAQARVNFGVAGIVSITDERTYATLKNVNSDVLCQFDADVSMGSQKVVNVGTPEWEDNTALINKGLCDDFANYVNLPPGTVLAFGNTTMPGGFLPCDGAAVSRTTYAALFAVIDVLYGGGNGLTTFNVPNMTDRVPVGYNSADAAFNVVGKTGGAATITLDATMMAAHDHGNIGYCLTHSTAFDSGGDAAGGEGPGAGTNTGSEGGGGAHNNLAPYIKLAYGIRV